MSPKLPISPSPQHPVHNILITIPRTASHLLTRLLNLPSQPSVSAHEKDGYFFLPALGHRYKHDLFARPVTSWTDTEQSGMQEALTASFTTWARWMDDTEQQSKETYVKEHVNWMIEPDTESKFLHETQREGIAGGAGEGGVRDPTCVPVTHWSRVRPTFLIRHPALAFASTLRAAIDNEGIEAVMRDAEVVMRWECTFHWHRALYCFLASQNLPRGALIVDAEDLGNVEFVKAYAAAVGLDPGVVRFEWEVATKGESGKLMRVERRMKDTILGSTGILTHKLKRADEVDLKAEIVSWRSEFGNVLAERLMGLVEGALGDYEWLRERRFCIQG